jgi:predicted HAD superfamily phosphohydrolase YqeG
MIPRLGNKYDIEIDIMAKPINDYMTDAYFELDLPVAPAIMVGDEIIVEGSDVEENKLEAAICRHLGLPGPAPSKKGIIGQLFKR